MIFDPFGDFQERGYLRNFAAEKDTEIVKRLEHAAFISGIDDAFSFLNGKTRIAYNDVLEVHRILFDAVYPWAGQDRLQTAPDLAISRGDVLFARPQDISRAVEYGLGLARDPDTMAAKPGEILGYLAYGHPFLDGNGRALMVVHTALAERAGISIDWARTDKTDYLYALTRELDAPGKGELDGYLRPFTSQAIGHTQLARHLLDTKGLGSSSHALDASEIAGSVNDPALQARYEQQELKRAVSSERSRVERDRDDSDERSR